MRSDRGLSTTQHCLQWYKLVLRILAYPLQQLQYPIDKAAFIHTSRRAAIDPRRVLDIAASTRHIASGEDERCQLMTSPQPTNFQH